ATTSSDLQIAGRWTKVPKTDQAASTLAAWSVLGFHKKLDFQKATIRCALGGADGDNGLAIERAVDVRKKHAGQRGAGWGGGLGCCVAQLGGQAGWVDIQHEEWAGDPLIETVGHFEQHGWQRRAVDESIRGKCGRQIGLVGGERLPFSGRHQMVNQRHQGTASLSRSVSCASFLAACCARSRRRPAPATAAPRMLRAYSPN